MSTCRRAVGGEITTHSVRRQSRLSWTDGCNSPTGERQRPQSSCSRPPHGSWGCAPRNSCMGKGQVAAWMELGVRTSKQLGKGQVAAWIALRQTPKRWWKSSSRPENVYSSVGIGGGVYMPDGERDFSVFCNVTWKMDRRPPKLLGCLSTSQGRGTKPTATSSAGTSTTMSTWTPARKNPLR